MTVPRIDESEWPLVQVHWQGEISAEDIEQHFDEILALLRRGRRFGLVMSLSGLDNPTSVLRRQAADRMNEMRDEAAATIVCNAHVVSSTAVRGILTAVYWMSPPPFETRVFTDHAKARAWALERLAEAGEG